MKINQDLSVSLNNVARGTKSAAADTSNFAEMVKSSGEKLQMDELNQLLSQLDEAGSKLARTRNFKDLLRFKALVKQFVKQAVDYSMKMKQSQDWNQFGESRKMQIVETIDQKLADLTEEYIRKEQPALDILGKIGEIKGLLINLYT
ncbi:hypothetical protein BpJC4_21360 [Weizmannia acidilactici]|uniref:YaaR family protein n=1 Tax=Weizmannia acidilactici TaxID=2607726 RepID=UPI00124D4867|nr:YaaR family protein [Weizmannia acidilactici]GER67665.1 hypothetical protein BpJC4_21360 [Weizmannia acidilactici]